MKRALDVQGHRGARALRPADTLTGFDFALSLGVSTLEMDAEITRDGRVVLAHDPWINPNIHVHADGSEIKAGPDGRGPLIRDLDIRQVREYDAGAKRDPRFPECVRVPGERIPCLEDVLIFVGDVGDERVEFCLELKFSPEEDTTVPYREFADRVISVVRSFGLTRRFIIQCFDLAPLAYVKEREPELRTLFLCARSPEENTLDARDGKPSPWTAGLNYANYKNITEFLKAAPYVDILAPHFDLLYPEHPAYLGATPAEIQAAGWKVVPWTVNERPDMERLIDLGVDGIISDYPNRLLAATRDKGLAVKNRD